MENKSLFAAITLAIALIATYFFYNSKVSELTQEIDNITTEYNEKIATISPTPITQKTPSSKDLSQLESLNTQLIQTRSNLEKTRKELSIAKSKASVLSSEIKQIKDVRAEVKSLQDSLKSAKQQLHLSDEKLNYLQGVFQGQNTEQVANNLARIATLKETSTGIAVTGLVVPAIGAATLVSYTVEEINNYCANIKNTMALEKKVFGKIVSLDDNLQQNYHQQCVVSLKDKVKKGLKKLQAKQ